MRARARAHAKATAAPRRALHGGCIIMPCDAACRFARHGAAQEGCALAAVDASATETKGTVLMKNAEDLMNYNVSEEKAMEKAI